MQPKYGISVTYLSLNFAAALISTSAFLLVGCAIRPLPENVTRYNTYDIVQKIRCEVRDGIRLRLRELLRFYGQNASLNAIESGELSYAGFLEFGVKELDPTPRRIIERYAKAVIAYEFDFDITEENKLTGNADFLNTFTRGTLTLKTSAGQEQKRQNQRNFKAIDNFDNLVSTPIMERVCARLEARIGRKFSQSQPKNYRYPITGSLGLSEVIDTFLQLNQSGNLVGNTKENPKLPTMADTMTFTTTVNGGVNPSVKLSTAGTGLKLAEAGLDATVKRVDEHKLVMALTLPREDQGVPVAVARSTLEEAAIIELDRQRILEINADTRAIRRSLLE